MTPPRDLDWLFRCRQCKHYYQVQADADEVRCRLKYCRYEPSVENKKFHELQMAIIEADKAKEKKHEQSDKVRQVRKHYKR